MSDDEMRRDIIEAHFETDFTEYVSRGKVNGCEVTLTTSYEFTPYNEEFYYVEARVNDVVEKESWNDKEKAEEYFMKMVHKHGLSVEE